MKIYLTLTIFLKTAARQISIQRLEIIPKRTVMPFADDFNSLFDRLHHPIFFANLVKIVKRIQHSESFHEIYSCLSDVRELFDVMDSLFIFFSPEDQTDETWRFLHDKNPDWCQDYESKYWFGDDEWVDYVRRATAPICDSALSVMRRHSGRASDFLRARGVQSTLLVPTGTDYGTAFVGCLFLFSPQKNYFENSLVEVGVAAESVSSALYRWMLARQRVNLIERAGLVQEDITLLQMVQKGMSSKEASKELCKSIAAINSRWQRINSRLGTANRKQAAKLAMDFGLI